MNKNYKSTRPSRGETIGMIDIPDRQWRMYQQFQIQHPQLSRFFEKYGVNWYQRLRGRL